jgi:aconitate hydratase 2/2-methylisocitrate dehydratase
MSIYSDYLREIEERKGQGLHPKPIDGAELLSEIITQIKDIENADQPNHYIFFIYNTVLVLHLQLKQFF